jgi:alpha-ketoglutarate-dependent taurine dioxygenase
MQRNNCYDLDKINVSFLDNTTKTLPLVISPRFDDSHEFICQWLEENRSWVEGQMLRYGAVLIRGFKIESAPDFEKATLALDPTLCNKYRGTSPRSLMEDTKYAFSAADVPVNYPIAQHLEMSFLKAPPRNLYFGCMKESKSMGGETALCDFRKVYQDLSPELRDKFLSKNIKYSRKSAKVGEKYTYDVAAMQTWIELFGTSSKSEVESICREEGSPEVQWVGPNRDTFLQEWVDKPSQLHPITNEPVWFNHTQVFHWTTFPAELWFAFCRMKEIKLFFHFLLVSIYSVIKYGLLGYKMSMYTSFGDDTPISVKEINEIRHSIHKHMVFSRWRKGDIMCIDNFSTSHGRQPTYDKGRKVIVAWSQSRDKTLPTAQKVTFSLTESSSEEVIDKLIPNLLAATPDSSPESSLTKQEAEVLQNSLLGGQIKDKLEIEISKGEGQLFHRRRHTSPDLFKAESDFWKNS